MTLKRRAFLASIMTVPLLAGPARAREPAVFQSAGVAINGADPLGYFDTGGPVIPEPGIGLVWHGAEWRFRDSQARGRFEMDPQRYAPRFGGYCAFAASRGYLAPTIPEAWTIHDGRLYLNANLRARELWLQDVPGNIAKGEANWPAILG